MAVGRPAGAPEIREAAFVDLDVVTLYAILQLRSDAFVVEQRCAYRDIDGRDTEPSTRHLWVPDAMGAVRAYLRTLAESNGTTRIGRVVTARSARGRGLADHLVRHAIAAASGAVVADAQAHLQDWYARRGFIATGPPYDDDGIDHVPMRRDPTVRVGGPVERRA